MHVHQESLALDFFRRVPQVPVLHVGTFGSACVGRPSEAVHYSSRVRIGMCKAPMRPQPRGFAFRRHPHLFTSRELSTFDF
jgi:hypothetical protein